MSNWISIAVLAEWERNERGDLWRLQLVRNGLKSNAIFLSLRCFFHDKRGVLKPGQPGVELRLTGEALSCLLRGLKKAASRLSL